VVEDEIPGTPGGDGGMTMEHDFEVGDRILALMGDIVPKGLALPTLVNTEDFSSEVFE